MVAGKISNSILRFYLLLLMICMALTEPGRSSTHHHEEQNIMLVHGHHNSMHAHSSSSHQMDATSTQHTGFFSINDLDLASHGFPKAKTIEETLRRCNFDSAEEELLFCATSLESMLDFTRTMSGTTDDDFRAIATIYLTKSLTHTITQVAMEVSVPKVMVACHFLSYPYAVFFCHGLDSEHENKLFKVPLVGENGDRVEGLAICQFETSTWDPNFPSITQTWPQTGRSNMPLFICK
ncbi:hypothetical protein Patl1_36372 [Pistacia atlantica]|nr:hypothetical protein Patl1_36372 [Pistacia atlantica]